MELENLSMIPIFGMITGIIINLALFTLIILAIYYSVKARNRERMALIEKGVDISEIYKKKEGYGFFKFGMILMGLGVGLFLGVLLSKFEFIPAVAAYFSMILLGGGAGIIFANILVQKKKVQ